MPDVKAIGQPTCWIIAGPNGAGALIIKVASPWGWLPRSGVEARTGALRAGRMAGILIKAGAGKTTFALQYLNESADCSRFVNADLIAAGLSPLAPER